MRTHQQIFSFVMIGILVYFHVSLGFSQNAVFVQASIPAQGQLSAFYPYQEITLVNNGSQALDLKLTALVTEANAGTIFEATSAVIQCQVGRTTINLDRIQPVDITNEHVLYQQFVRNTASLPPGNYNICITAVDAGSAAFLAKGCNQQTIEPSPGARLLQPPNNSIVKGGKVVFNWASAQAKILSELPLYDFRIVENELGQNPEEAIKNNKTWYGQGSVKGNTITYPENAPAFVPGKTYSWQITARSGELITGMSEVFTFVFSQ